jgi:hypothetical protein
MTEAGKALIAACLSYQAQVDVMRAIVAGDADDFYHNNELSLNEKMWFECGKKHGITEHYFKKVYYPGWDHGNPHVSYAELEDRAEGAHGLEAVLHSLAEIEDALKEECGRSLKAVRKFIQKVEEMQATAKFRANADRVYKVALGKRSREEDLDVEVGEQPDATAVSASVVSENSK